MGASASAYVQVLREGLEASALRAYRLRCLRDTAGTVLVRVVRVLLGIVGKVVLGACWF